MVSGKLVSVGNEIEMNCSGYVDIVKRRNRNWGRVVGKEIQNIQYTVYSIQHTAYRIQNTEY